MDTYSSFNQIRTFEREGRDFRIAISFRKGSRTVIIAPHGGNIEPGTSELAVAIAGADMHIAIFEGLKTKGNSVLHLTSTHFDEPGCTHIVGQSDFVVALHGERSSGNVVYLGGGDMTLAKTIRHALKEKGFDVRTHQNRKLQGRAPRNICNRGRRGMGVQLELSRGLRSAFFFSLTADGRKHKTRAFYRFVAAIRQGLRKCGALSPRG